MRLSSVRVAAGNHGRRWCPVEAEVSLPADVAEADLALRDGTNGRYVPFQIMRSGAGVRICLVVDDLPVGGERTYELLKADTPVTCLADGVTVTQDGGTLSFLVGGAPFSTYRFGPDVVRPYFYPLYAEPDVGITRNWPMVADVPGETNDHPHHKGLFTAQGEVNGVDNWAEGEGHGFQVHKAFVATFSGPVAGGFEERLEWTDSAKRSNMAETRRVTVYATPQGLRILDYDVTLTAEFGQVTLGDTKEGGLVSVRVATSMDAAREDGGRILNASGGLGEAETWGKRAPWCDYSGPVGPSWYGICMMDHPSNPRHPTYWHVRDYGLMTANCFGVHHFTADPGNRRDLVLASGSSLTWHYRVLVHGGAGDLASLTRAYQDFANGPTVTVE